MVCNGRWMTVWMGASHSFWLLAFGYSAKSTGQYVIWKTSIERFSVLLLLFIEQILLTLEHVWRLICLLTNVLGTWLRLFNTHLARQTRVAYSCQNPKHLIINLNTLQTYSKSLNRSRATFSIVYFRLLLAQYVSPHLSIQHIAYQYS
jgi:hypothetical protein